MYRTFKIGSRARVCDGSGLDSGKVGTVIVPVLNHRGIPVTTGGGDYKPFTATGRMAERMLKTDAGETFTMFTARLTPET
jgi:hypothetical protein